jgi:hypothetical protein
VLGSTASNVTDLSHSGGLLRSGDLLRSGGLLHSGDLLRSGGLLHSGDLLRSGGVLRSGGLHHPYLQMMADLSEKIQSVDEKLASAQEHREHLHKQGESNGESRAKALGGAMNRRFDEAKNNAERHAWAAHAHRNELDSAARADRQTASTHLHSVLDQNEANAGARAKAQNSRLQAALAALGEDVQAQHTESLAGTRGLANLVETVLDERAPAPSQVLTQIGEAIKNMAAAPQHASPGAKRQRVPLGAWSGSSNAWEL